MEELLGEKYKLRDSISKKQLSLYGLPVDLTSEKGVYFKNAFNKDEIILNETRNVVYYEFQYFDEHGKLNSASLRKSEFERIFEQINKIEQI